MAPAVVKRVQDDAASKAQPMKACLLDTNLTRLKALLSVALTTAINSIDNEVKARFPEFSLLFSASEAQSQFAELSTFITGGYKSKGESYDTLALPEGYTKTLQDSLDSQQYVITAKIQDAWSTWVLNLNQTHLKDLTAALQKLGAETKVGDTKVYNLASSYLILNSQLDFDKAIEAEYKWSDKEGQERDYAHDAQRVFTVQQALWTQNDEEVKKQAADLLTNLKSTYSI